MFIFFILLILFSFSINQDDNATEKHLQKICQAYPEHFVYCKDNVLKWKDGTEMIFDDKKEKNWQEILESPDIEDQMKIPYPKGKTYEPLQKGQDPGRIRNEMFFRKMYGNSQKEVQEKLTKIIWLPKTLQLPLRVTTVNQVHKKLDAISKELDEKPHLTKYLQKIGGTFSWRNISGTNRLSMHSFGMTIDINLTYSNYWQWDNRTTDENTVLKYRNQIPMEIVEVFEKYGFIWGGKWYHYDTMHFEYRPELL
jgi:hypothetical protein